MMTLFSSKNRGKKTIKQAFLSRGRIPESPLTAFSLATPCNAIREMRINYRKRLCVLELENQSGSNLYYSLYNFQTKGSSFRYRP